MRLLSIGDIHGGFTALTALWKIFQPSQQDVVVFLGDYVDRGPESKQVLDCLVNEVSRANRIFLRGNHEVMMLGAAEDPFRPDSWRACGGLETLMSYGLHRTADWPDEIPEKHWTFLRSTLPYHETEKHIFVHACLDSQVELARQNEGFLYWQTFEQLWPHKSGKKVVCGHTTLASGEIVDVGHAVCIETGVAYDGWLTCLDVNSGEFWQSNQEGETRTGKLP